MVVVMVVSRSTVVQSSTTVPRHRFSLISELARPPSSLERFLDLPTRACNNATSTLKNTIISLLHTTCNAI